MTMLLLETPQLFLLVNVGSMVYAMIYKNFFIQFYGELTISRNPLTLTDDDIAEWGPLDDCIKTVTCWQGPFTCYDVSCSDNGLLREDTPQIATQGETN